MPLLSVDHRPEGLCLHHTGNTVGPDLNAALHETEGPVRILVHGFNYAPGKPRHCPHQGILARNPTRSGFRTLSWPRHMGLRGQRDEPLVIGFGWAARGPLHRAYRAAEIAALDLATLVRQIGPDRPVQIVAHSLGARVALCTLRSVAPSRVSHMVLLAAAEFSAPAEAALQSPAGRTCSVLHATGRDNDLFDAMFETLLPDGWFGARGLGYACPDLPNLTTLHLDDPATRAALRALGFPVADTSRRICHWSPYTRPGVFPLYRAFVEDRISARQLQLALPNEVTPRWSRLCPRVTLPKPQWRFVRQT